ncbi:hypothetical protein [Saccharopolyspora shandongensis]|uniref:hypothetical protein n=1 Tax=Saccharopolyspora shandongensis TaxID=418495 RepID=UPI0015A6B8A3|nr:hypothetical protein [Saccharopolyspora shandongensis]
METLVEHQISVAGTDIGFTSFEGINPGHARLARYPVKVDGDEVYIDPDGDTPKVAHC